ncbi:MAG: type I-E CRISPR-associated protein Cse2/CasB [Synergistaceae bacterium]|nr:type I-E CRISPR-associated protein Cse2/CasB [Synergistaceae bacterium]MBQ6983257.1 type I-E CRISPR-associated protein Cse2/CasB [Synergistaceae bacterium]MBR0247861.1 type I-E CRISPR-associated protein Cse2/CasB [Synergistaceae bacterium]
MRKKISKTDQVKSYVGWKINSLHDIADTGTGKGMLANIRRGVGKSPGEIPELWGLIFNNMPEELLGTRGASPAEWAVYTALTLYALHQQGNEKFMNVEDVSVGKAASMLVKNDEDEDRIRRRLGLVVTATSPSDLAYHLRGVIQLLSREEIGLDYARLARDLYLMNYEERAKDIKLAWGRDFYIRKKAEDENAQQ